MCVSALFATQQVSSYQTNSQCQAICVPHPLGRNPTLPLSCRAPTLCTIETPVCIQTNQGPHCIKDPCPGLSCSEGTVCQVDGEGNGICMPITQPTTCQLVDCPADRPICTETEQGPICIEFDCTNTVCGEGEVCFERAVLCKKSPCIPIPECITDPCVDGLCALGTTCTINEMGVAVCEPIYTNTCLNVRCTIEKPICVDTSTGPRCVAHSCNGVECKDGDVCIEQVVPCSTAPCPANPTCMDNPCKLAKCSLGFFCDIDNAGGVKCAPDPNVCDKVECPLATDICTAVQKKCGESRWCPYEAICSAVDTCAHVKCRLGRTCKDGSCIRANGEPLWWNLIQQKFTGVGLQRCKGFGNVPPANGTKCSKKPKTCFFGDQECQGIGPFPRRRCKCRGGTWKCDKDLVCPTTLDFTIN